MRGLVLAALLLVAFPAAAQSISGQARALDGDTIELAGQRVRLHGIDAPEIGQTCDSLTEIWLTNPPRNKTYDCGNYSASQLDVLLRARSVTCHPRDRDRYGRIVATCSTTAGDIGAAMVRSGWAVDYTKYSQGKYAAEQNAAKAEKAGMWSGRFDMPEVWRKARR